MIIFLVDYGLMALKTLQGLKPLKLKNVVYLIL